MNETFQSVSTFGLSSLATFSGFKSSMRYLTLLLLVFAMLVPFKTDAEDINERVPIGSAPPPLTADQLEQRGKQLRDEIRQKTDEWNPGNSLAKLNVSSTIAKYIPVGSSFKDAKTILSAAGIDLALPPPPPTRALHPGDPGYNSFDLMGGYTVYGHLFGNKVCAINIKPEKPGDPNTIVKRVSAAIYIDSL